MSAPPLIRSQSVRHCFEIGQIPWLAKLYCHIYERKRRSHVSLLYGAVMRRVFRALHCMLGFPVWGNFRYHSSSGPVPVHFDSRNTQFHSIYFTRYKDGYEPETCVLLDAFLSGRTVVWDVGSNWGHFSLYACSHPEFEGQVHAFEPIKSTFRDLRHTVQEARLDDQIRCHAFALGERHSKVSASIADGVHSGLAMLGGTGPGETVDVQSADSLSIADPTMIKLDVEGFESAVLKGAKRVLERSRPMIIMESWLHSPEKTLEPLRFLEIQGYQLFQPAWLIANNNGSYYSRQYHTSNPSRRIGLALLPLTSAERCVLGEYANLFACHSSRLLELKQRFSSEVSLYENSVGA